MPPDIANEELSPEQEALYEGQMKLVSDNFDKLLDEDDPEDID